MPCHGGDGLQSMAVSRAKMVIDGYADSTSEGVFERYHGAERDCAAGRPADAGATQQDQAPHTEQHPAAASQRPTEVSTCMNCKYWLGI